MEKSEKISQNEEKVKAVYATDRVNLQEFGYGRSGSVQGDPEVYASYLERILNGDLVEENYKGLSEKERTEKRQKIKDLEKVYDETVKNNEKAETEIAKKEKQIDDRRAELLQIHEKRADDDEKLLHESFSPLKFGVNLFLLIALSGYLFFFYISATYKALYNDFEKIANSIAEGIGVGSIMPGPAELSEALQYNYLLLLVPFVFYAFGWAFHVILEMKHQAKIAFLSGLIIVTFIVDLLLALIIHTNTETAKDLMGLPTIKWSASPTFYIILCLGFLVYIIWSILLDSLLREWKKRQITYNLKRIIRYLRKDIAILSKKLLPADQIRNEIDRLSDEVNTYVQGNLKAYIDQFTAGWVSFLAPENMKEKKNKCLQIRNDFMEEHGIRPGIVKVVKKNRRG
jgi:hypothetical protein